MFALLLPNINKLLEKLGLLPSLNGKALAFSYIGELCNCILVA
jgi:hypothetical protein